MKSLRRASLAVGALALLALSGCATRASVRRLQIDVAAVKNELAELRKAQDATTRELAKTVVELKALDGQVAKVAEAEADKGTQQEVSRLEARLGETEEAVRGLRASLDGLSRELVRQATAAAVPASPAPAVKHADAKPAEPAPTMRSGPADHLYAAALASFRAREHGQAVLEFTDFLARYPQHPLAANAQFWIAEAYYLQHDYRQALAEYEKVAELDSRGGKAPDALLKTGLCLRALNEPARAEETWQQLIERFPDSEAARQARTLVAARAVPVRRAR